MRISSPIGFKTFISGLSVSLLLGAHSFAELPERLERALSVSVQEIDAQRVEVRISEGEHSIQAYVFPGIDDAPDQYELIEPASEDDLSEDQLAIWVGLREPEDDDNDGSEDEDDRSDLTFDGAQFRAMIGTEVEPLGEQDGVMVYGFQPQAMPGEDEPDRTTRRMLDAMTGTIGLTRHAESQTDIVAFIELTLEDSVKPNFAARVDAFEMVQRFVHDEDLAGPRLSRLSIDMAGSAAFQEFSENFSMDIIDITYRQTDPNP